MSSPDASLLCLDVGSVRIGVARANLIARIAEPLETIANDDVTIATLQKLIDENNATTVVVGLPLNRNQDDTEQTKFVRDFVQRLEAEIGVPVAFQDEADSSKRAEQLLQSKGRPYPKEAVDAEAATLILQDYIEEQL